MKRLLISICSLFFTGILSAQDFTVTQLSVDIYLRAEGHFDVVEVYDVNFHRDKHGIYRDIQTKYDFIDPSGERTERKIKIKNIEVPGHKFDAPSAIGQKYSDQLRIKIGDANKWVIGDVKYEIRYTVENAYIFKTDQTQFYWNIKTDGWWADFESIAFRVIAPDGTTLNEQNTFVYSGQRGTTTTSQDFDLTFNGSTLAASSKEGYVFGSSDNVTVLINLPSGVIQEIKPAWPFWADYGWVLVIMTLLGSYYTLWKRYGQDPPVVATTSYYPPKELDPPMAGYLINDHYDKNDLVSLIPYWGSKGILRLEELKSGSFWKKKDIQLVRLADLPESASSYQKEIFNGLFSNSKYTVEGQGNDRVLVSSLKDSFYKTMNSASSDLSKNARQYYDKQSRKVRMITYLVVVVLGVLLTFMALYLWNITAAVVTAVSCLALLILNFFMIKKNRKGAKLYSELKGFRNFIKMAEEHRLKMLIQEDKSYFETTMGYALAFGLFNSWAKKFDTLNIPPPNWYRSSSVDNSSMSNFSNSFNNSMSKVTSNMVSAPSSSGSSGGGSSGGGFGGGGGGSW